MTERSTAGAIQTAEIAYGRGDFDTTEAALLEALAGVRRERQEGRADETPQEVGG